MKSTSVTIFEKITKVRGLWCVCVYVGILYASPTSTDRPWEVAEQRPEGEQLRVTIERLNRECGT